MSLLTYSDLGAPSIRRRGTSANFSASLRGIFLSDGSDSLLASFGAGSVSCSHFRRSVYRAGRHDSPIG